MASWAGRHALALLGLAVFSLLLAVACVALMLWQRRQGAALAASLDQASTQIDTMFTHDALTGLMSRSEFDLALDEAVLRSDRSGERFSLIYLDLDNLGSVNTAFGLEVGDEVLREAAHRVLACFDDEPPQASRIAADEFAVIVRGSLGDGRRAAAAVAAAIGRPYHVNGREAQLSCSIGIAAYPQHGSRPRLLGNAALAMRSVKHAGGGAHADYDERMSLALREEADLLHDLRGALERREFELFYQPKVDAQTREITAAEALLRWHHPRRGVVSPVVFIPLAERYGLIGSIGAWVIEESCRQASAWRERGLRMRVAVNVSGYQLRQEDLVERVQAALRSHRIPASRFTVEITESVAMEDTRVTREAFERLREAGVHVSIDDFGTGHSSLASLRRLPAAELKIDRAFVSDLETSEDARAIARAIVQMAHSLGLRVVAEGVETEGQRDELVLLGCDELQGYLFAKPMTAQALALWAAEDQPALQGPAHFRASLFDETQAAELGPG